MYLAIVVVGAWLFEGWLFVLLCELLASICEIPLQKFTYFLSIFYSLVNRNKEKSGYVQLFFLFFCVFCFLWFLFFCFLWVFVFFIFYGFCIFLIFVGTATFFLRLEYKKWFCCHRFIFLLAPRLFLLAALLAAKTFFFS